MSKCLFSVKPQRGWVFISIKNGNHRLGRAAFSIKESPPEAIKARQNAQHLFPKEKSMALKWKSEKFFRAKRVAEIKVVSKWKIAADRRTQKWRFFKDGKKKRRGARTLHQQGQAKGESLPGHEASVSDPLPKGNEPDKLCDGFKHKKKTPFRQRRIDGLFLLLNPKPRYVKKASSFFIQISSGWRHFFKQGTLKKR